MMASQGADLQEILITGAHENWCTRRNCTTCGCPEMRELLGEGDFRNRKYVSTEHARQLAYQMSRIDKVEFSERLSASEEYWVRTALMWLMYGIWRHLGDTAHAEVFPILEGSWSDSIYQSMKAHYQRVRGI